MHAPARINVQHLQQAGLSCRICTLHAINHAPGRKVALQYKQPISTLDTSSKLEICLCWSGEFEQAHMICWAHAHTDRWTDTIELQNKAQQKTVCTQAEDLLAGLPNLQRYAVPCKGNVAIPVAPKIRKVAACSELGFVKGGAAQHLNRIFGHHMLASKDFQQGRFAYKRTVVYLSKLPQLCKVVDQHAYSLSTYLHHWHPPKDTCSPTRAAWTCPV